LPLLSEQISLDELWDTLGECLSELGRTSDSHAVLVLQPAVEAFFLVHGTEKQVMETYGAFFGNHSGMVFLARFLLFFLPVLIPELLEW